MKIRTGILVAALSLPLLLRADDRINVPVRINGQILRFGFDTGTGIETCIWRSNARRLGIKVTPPPADSRPAPGNVNLGVTEPVTVEFMGHTFTNARLAVLDVPPFANWDVGGVVGWPAVHRNIWLIDPAGNQVQLVSGVPGEAGQWPEFKLKTDLSVLALELSAGPSGNAGVLMIDTGSQGGVFLAPAGWAAWKAAHSGSPVTMDAYLTSSGSFVVREVGWADRLALGHVVLHDVTVEEAGPEDVASGGPGYAGTLGMAALRRLILVVDGIHGIARVHAREESPGYVSYNRLGAVFVPPATGSGALVAHVAPGSPAAAAGIRDGDRLLTIDKIDVTHWKTQSLPFPPWRFFDQPAGTRFTLTLQRDAGPFTVAVVLRNILNPGEAEAGTTRPALVLPDFEFVPALAAATNKAAALGVPTDRLVPAGPGAGQALAKGDTITALVSEVDRGRLRQWLVELVAKGATPEKGKPRKPVKRFTSTGREIQFDAEDAGIAIRVIGPFHDSSGAPSPKDVWSGALVSAASLRQGLDGLCAADAKIIRAGLSFAVQSRPFPAQRTASDAAKARAAGLTAGDEGAFVGGTLALHEFYEIASRTPGLRDILREELGLSWWSMLKQPWAAINILGPATKVSGDLWGLPAGAPCYELGLLLNLDGKPRLLCRLAVTHPDRPLQAAGGIVGLAARRPDGSGPYLVVRVLAAHCAPTGPRGGS